MVVLLGPQTAKWAYLLIAIVAYGWLLGMVGNDTLPQKSAAAAMTLVLSFTAARDLLEYASQPAALEPAIKRTILDFLGVAPEDGATDIARAII